MVIVTTAGAITVQEAILKAANQNDNILSGFVHVTDEYTDVGVIEGGALIVSTSNGQSTIQPGNRLRLLAMAQPKSNLSQAEIESLKGNEGAGAMEEDDDDSYLPAAILAFMSSVAAYSADRNRSNDETASKPAP